MKYKSVQPTDWLYQKPNGKYYDCGIRAVLNAYQFWNGPDPNIKQKLYYYRKKYGPYVGKYIGETEIGETYHLAHELGLSMLPIVPTEKGINGVLRYDLPVICASVPVKNMFGSSGPHAFCILPGWNAINVFNKPIHKIAFDNLMIPEYEVGKPWYVLDCIIPKKYSLKYIRHTNSIDGASLFRIMSETIYADENYK